MTDRVVPATAIEGPAGCNRLDIDAPQVLRVLGAVLDRVVDGLLDEVVAVPRHGTEGEGVHPSCGDLVLAVPPRGLDGFLDQPQSVLEVAACRGAADRDARVAGNELVAEARADLERTPGVLDAPVGVTAVEGLKGLRMKNVRVLALLGTVRSEL